VVYLATSSHLFSAILNKTININFCDGCLKRRTVDSCGNSTCLKTPQSALLEEAEAVPAESNGPQRKTNPRICRSLYQLRGLKVTTLFAGTKRAFIKQH